MGKARLLLPAPVVRHHPSRPRQRPVRFVDSTSEMAMTQTSRKCEGGHGNHPHHRSPTCPALPDGGRDVGTVTASSGQQSRHDNLSLLVAAAETCERLGGGVHPDDLHEKDHSAAAASPKPAQRPEANLSLLARHREASVGGIRQRGTKGKPYRPSYVNDTDSCQVCGDASSGRHYRVLSCEGCKGFFRRTIQNNREYHCRGDNTCSLLRSGKSRCQACRIRKCYQAGMDRQLVMQEDERQAKRRLIEDRRRQRRAEQAAQGRGGGDSQQTDSQSDDGEERLIKVDETEFRRMDRALAQLPLGLCAIRIAGLQEDELSLAQDFSGLRRLLELAKNRVADLGMAIPCFSTLPEADRTELLTTWSTKILILNAAWRYGHQDNGQCAAFRYGQQDEGQRTQTGSTTECEQASQHAEWRLQILRVAGQLARLEVDQREMALASAYMLLRPECDADSYCLELQSPHLVRRLEEELLELLMWHVTERRNPDCGVCGGLLHAIFRIQHLPIHDSDLLQQHCDGSLFVSPVIHIMFRGCTQLSCSDRSPLSDLSPLPPDHPPTLSPDHPPTLPPNHLPTLPPDHPPTLPHDHPHITT